MKLLVTLTILPTFVPNDTMPEGWRWWKRNVSNEIALIVVFGCHSGDVDDDADESNSSQKWVVNTLHC